MSAHTKYMIYNNSAFQEHLLFEVDNPTMTDISEDLMAEYKDAFSLFDKRGDNCIDSVQLGDVLRALGLNPTEAEVKKARADCEASGQKRIPFETFLPIYLSVQVRQTAPVSRFFFHAWNFHLGGSFCCRNPSVPISGI
eukprot:sb/3474344/